MNTPSSYRHLFFDLDGTITRSRVTITPEMKNLLAEVRASGREVVVVSGAQKERLDEQADMMPAVYLAQNGNHAYVLPTGEELWRDLLTAEEKAAIITHTHSLPRTWDVVNENDLIEDRGSQISYSLLGHHEDIVKKEAFDPSGARRAALLAEHPLTSPLVEVKIGGTTTFDYFRKGSHKGSNVARYIEAQGWNKGECIYFGDALFPGGNDEAVVGVIETIQVSGPEDTAAFLKEVIGE